MICPKCGAQAHDEAVFCPKCGESLQPAPMDDGLGQYQKSNDSQYNNQQYQNGQYGNQQYGSQPYGSAQNDGQQYGGQPYNNQQYNGQQYGGQQYGQMPAGGGYIPPNDKKNNTGIIIGIVIASVVVFLIAVYMAFAAYSGMWPFGSSEKPEPTPTPAPISTPTPSPTSTPTPVPTQMPTLPPINLPTQAPAVSSSSSSSSSSAVANPTYTTFKSDAYGFSCAYPSHFKVYNDGGTLTLWTGCTSDGSAREIIVATPIGNETVNSSFNNYTSSHRGSITYQTKGSDYYAVCINDGTTEYYKYCKFKNGNMYWFEFISPHAEHAIYDIYINDIYNSFNIK